MSSPLPTLNDMLNPQKKQAPQSNPPKEENKIVEEENKVEENVEEKKEEGKKEEEPKVEEDPKKKKEAPKVPPKPREPEPKIPTDFKDLIKEITDIKASGNELVKNQSYEEAISKYKEGYDKL